MHAVVDAEIQHCADALRGSNSSTIVLSSIKKIVSITIVLHCSVKHTTKVRTALLATSACRKGEHAGTISLGWYSSVATPSSTIDIDIDPLELIATSAVINEVRVL